MNIKLLISSLNLEKKNYIEAMKAFSEISLELENFFENVQVNVDNKEIRNNRLKLLSLIRDVFLNFADFSSYKNFANSKLIAIGSEMISGIIKVVSCSTIFFFLISVKFWS